jgi:hypothetical protein
MPARDNLFSTVPAPECDTVAVSAGRLRDDVVFAATEAAFALAARRSDARGPRALAHACYVAALDTEAAAGRLEQSLEARR